MSNYPDFVKELFLTGTLAAKAGGVYQQCLLKAIHHVYQYY